MGVVYSDQTNKYKTKLSQLEDSQPASYQSKYQSTIDNILGKISNREPFSYDFNADPIYQQYKDQYTKLGNEASMNAAANASALTGGYGSSYATTAASQANQQYLTQLNNVIPDLYNAAMEKYQMDSEDNYNQLSAYQNQESMDYSKYRDFVDDYYTNRSYYQSAYADSRDFDYTDYRNQVADDQWNKEYALSLASLNKSSGSGSSKSSSSDTTTTTSSKSSGTVASSTVGNQNVLKQITSQIASYKSQTMNGNGYSPAKSSKFYLNSLVSNKTITADLAKEIYEAQFPNQKW